MNLNTYPHIISIHKLWYIHMVFHLVVSLHILWKSVQNSEQLRSASFISKFAQCAGHTLEWPQISYVLMRSTVFECRQNQLLTNRVLKINRPSLPWLGHIVWQRWRDVIFMITFLSNHDCLGRRLRRRQLWCHQRLMEGVRCKGMRIVLGAERSPCQQLARKKGFTNAAARKVLLPATQMNLEADSSPQASALEYSLADTACSLMKAWGES